MPSTPSRRKKTAPRTINPDGASLDARLEARALKKGKDYTGAAPWNGNDLKGTWEFTLKIDGVRTFMDSASETGWISRNGKPLYNLPTAMPGGGGIPKEGFEVYCSKPGRSSKENYKATIECVRAKTKDRPIRPDELYSLEPLDRRLWVGPFIDPDAETIKAQMDGAVLLGYEGLILREVGGKGRWLKVKPIETYDVYVTQCIEGTGKHKGRLGAVMTDMGKVGTGFTDEERKEWWAWWTGTIKPGNTKRMIEVECMQLTPDGKFRHPRFVRIRYDK